MIAFWRNHPWRLRVAALLASAALVGLLQSLVPQALTGLEQFAGDLSWRVGAHSTPERRVVVVDIDVATADEVVAEIRADDGEAEAMVVDMGESMIAHGVV